MIFIFIEAFKYALSVPQWPSLSHTKDSTKVVELCKYLFLLFWYSKSEVSKRQDGRWTNCDAIIQVTCETVYWVKFNIAINDPSSEPSTTMKKIEWNIMKIRSFLASENATLVMQFLKNLFPIFKSDQEGVSWKLIVHYRKGIVSIIIIRATFLNAPADKILLRYFSLKCNINFW